jgi:leader peptidase (prepilin peptidase) / N-methyltransferase
VGSAVFWWGLAAALGPLCGFLVARASLQLPDRDGPAAPPSARRYALAMAACTVGFLWTMSVSPGPLALIGGLLGCQLMLIAMLDAEHFWLPHRLTVPLGLMGLAQAAAFQPDQFVDRLIGAAVGFAALASIAWVYRRARGRDGMGGGDFRLLAAAGAWVGWIGLPSVLVLGSVAGLVVVGARTARGKALNAAEEVPFGVYLAVGLWLTWLYGPLGGARL